MKTHILYHRCHYCQKKQIATGCGGELEFVQGWRLITIHPHYYEACCPECFKKHSHSD